MLVVGKLGTGLSVPRASRRSTGSTCGHFVEAFGAQREEVLLITPFFIALQDYEARVVAYTDELLEAIDRQAQKGQKLNASKWFK